MESIFKYEMLIYQSKANLNVTFCWHGAKMGMKIPSFILVHDLLAIEI